MILRDRLAFKYYQEIRGSGILAYVGDLVLLMYIRQPR